MKIDFMCDIIKPRPGANISGYCVYYEDRPSDKYGKDREKFIVEKLIDLITANDLLTPGLYRIRRYCSGIPTYRQRYASDYHVTAPSSSITINKISAIGDTHLSDFKHDIDPDHSFYSDGEYDGDDSEYAAKCCNAFDKALAQIFHMA